MQLPLFRANGVDPRILTGGAKHKWIREHQERLLEELRREGWARVADRYHMDYLTLNRFWHSVGGEGPPPSGVAENEKAL